MKAYVGITDRDWFDLLRSASGLEEVNFWQPSGNREFKVLKPGELFLFKLHSPDNYIVGGGIFAHSTLLPVSLAWEAFGKANGAETLSDMRSRISKYRRSGDDHTLDYTIGCILLEQPFFLPPSLWIPVPSDWKSSIVQGRSYDLQEEPGRTLWNVLQNIQSFEPVGYEEEARYGEPVMTCPRLGQGSFRILVTDAYKRRCAITRERTLPALDAAHIKPYSESGSHIVSNGLLLRRDMHALFDKGYITVTKEMHVEVSRKIKEEFENGRDYYKYHGGKILLPGQSDQKPSPEYIEWHNSNVYRG